MLRPRKSHPHAQRLASLVREPTLAGEAHLRRVTLRLAVWLDAVKAPRVDQRRRGSAVWLRRWLRSLGGSACVTGSCSTMTARPRPSVHAISLHLPSLPPYPSPSYLPPFSLPTSHPLPIPPSSPTIVHQYDRLIVGSLSQPLGAKIGMRSGEHTQGRRGGGAGGHHHSAQGSWKSNASAASIATSSTGPAAHAELRFGAVDAVLELWPLKKSSSAPSASACLTRYLNLPQHSSVMVDPSTIMSTLSSRAVDVQCVRQKTVR